MQQNIIACIDDSQYATSVCDFAAWSAERLTAPLVLLHALDHVHGEGNKNLSGTLDFGSQEALLEELAELDEKRAKLSMEQGKLMLKAAQEHVTKTSSKEIQCRQRHGELLETLLDIESETRMVVVGKRGAGSASEHGHIGSHVESIIRSLNKPVLIAQQTFIAPKKFMVAFDGSETMLKGIQMIIESPLLKGIPCDLVMVGTDADNNRAVLAATKTTLVEAGFEVDAKIIPGNPDIALEEYQQKNAIDLMVMGAYGHSKIRHFIVGSTTTAMICRTRVALLVLR